MADDASQRNHQELVSLRDYLVEKVTSLEQRLEQQRVYTERALDKAKLALGRRLDAMNEFREALKDQAARMATQEQLDRVRDRIVEQEKRMAVVAGEASSRASLLAGLWSLVASVVVGLTIRWLVK